MSEQPITPASSPAGKKTIMEKFKGMGIIGKALTIVVGAFLVLFAISFLCAGLSFCAALGSPSSGTSDSGTHTYATATPTTQAAGPTVAATPRPTATPKPTAALTGYKLYSTWDKEKIKAEAQSVGWNDFIRYPGNYEGKLISLKGHVTFDNTDWSGKTYFTVDVNPTFFNDHKYSNSDSYTPQYVEFDYNTEGVIDGDDIMMYGVYEGDTTFTDYPIINGVYCIRYT